jgi:protein-tyrosine-phosphatase
MSTSGDTRHALFLCTGNSARSIIAEAILNRLGRGRIRADSAGSQPKAHPHPLALEVLTERGYDTSGLRTRCAETRLHLDRL